MNGKPRPANSFSEEEVKVANALFDKLTRKGDITTLVRHPAFASLARKFLHMRRMYEGRSIERDLDEAREASR